MSEPIEKFQNWYEAARVHPEILDASAMALATASRDGRPSVRMVLLKACDERGLVFYTNLNSPKAHDLEDNPQAELCFHWVPMRRQVRVRGTVERVTSEEADAYFATRPRMSQIGAWASAQSAVMPHGLALESAVGVALLQFGLGTIPRPAHWSGFRVVPAAMEFWVEQPFRQHRRSRYTRGADGLWRRELLFP